GELNADFDSAITRYTTDVVNDVTSVTVTPTVSDAQATVTVNGSVVSSGQSSSPIPLNVGGNEVNIVVTAEDSSTKTYSIHITRAG
ncbi:cadherin-like beta sandwich domain-containing protein, partial [Burkholderia sp. SIMBA_024]|uniref:cadherin-like beta sandwich domain-containing protein n=1 Tax=Burkholderia sp. SIMBA_024 TaxID=3085768 RepID=UPI00397DA39B